MLIGFFERGRGVHKYPKKSVKKMEMGGDRFVNLIIHGLKQKKKYELGVEAAFTPPPFHTLLSTFVKYRI